MSFGRNRRITHKYRQIRRIGGGGMADVYECIHVITKKRVALKLLKDHSNPEMVERFRNEAELSREVTHENLCEVLEHGIYHSQPCLVMPLLRGYSLTESIERAPLAAEKAITIACQCLAALQILHEHDVVHRDIKPSNIFLHERKESGELVITPKIIDFGVAKRQERVLRLTLEGEIPGTTDYISPEVLLGAEPSVSSDIYALGVVLYEALTGEMPAEENPAQTRTPQA